MNIWRAFLQCLVIAIIVTVPNSAAADVTFKGLSDDLEKNARALMAIATVACEAPEWRVRRVYRDSDLQLRDALEALGHYRYELIKELSFAEEDCWQADFTLTLGEPVRIRNVSITIGGDASTDTGLEPPADLRPEVGSVLNHGRYETYKKSLVSTLAARGYFDAELLESRVTVDESLQHAEILMRIASGPRYYFGEVSFSQPILTPRLLAGYVKFKKGDPYDADKVSELHELLNGSGYFGSVSIQAEPTAETGLEVPVFASITPGKRRVFTAGAGYATDTGLQGRLGYTNRRRNPKGHQFDTRLFLSKVDSERANMGILCIRNDAVGLRGAVTNSNSTGGMESVQADEEIALLVFEPPCALRARAKVGWGRAWEQVGPSQWHRQRRHHACSLRC